jgi:hypothetical protein
MANWRVHLNEQALENKLAGYLEKSEGLQQCMTADEANHGVSSAYLGPMETIIIHF